MQRGLPNLFRALAGLPARGWLALAAGALLAASSCSTLDRAVLTPVSNEGAEFVGDAACVDCHKTITDVFPGSMHARVHLANQSVGKTGCETCHGPASRHVAAGTMQRRGMFITNPNRDPAACFQCHPEIQAEFRLPYKHPADGRMMSCVNCHDPHGPQIVKPKGLAIARRDAQCAECHQEQARQFTFEHEALREGCVICHQPHGSIHADMLLLRDANLCLRCHAQLPGGAGTVLIGKTDHSTFLTQGTCWTGGCHTGVHGSNINPHLRY